MQKLCQPIYKKYNSYLITIIILTIDSKWKHFQGWQISMFIDENKNLILSPSFLRTYFRDLRSLIPKPDKEL